MYTKKSLYFVSFSILLISLITSCANFMKGENLKKEIEEKIEHENAAYCKVRISPSKNASENTGMTIPSANVYANVYKPQDNIDLSFEPSASWKFHYWTAEPAGSVEFTGGIKSISTTAHLLNDNDGDEILIMPHCEPRLEPQLSKPNDPVNPKNSSITLRFEYELSNSEADLNDISVEIAGENIKEYFEDPVYESNKHEIKFEAKSDKILDFTSGTKIVKITIPSKFYYTVNGLNVEMADDKILEYKINEETIDKLKFEWQKGRHGDFESLYDSEKNILESQIVNFIMDQNCYFSGWEITTAKINSGEVDEFNIVTDPDYKDAGSAKLVKDASGKTILRMIEPSEIDAKLLAANDFYRVTLEVLSAYDEKIIVKPVVYERPTVTFSQSSLMSYPKNNPISIHFSKPIANLIELENEIKIEIDGSSVKENFIAPKYSEDLKSITYEANTNNFIDTQNTTKTVTVTIPKDFYYEDGAEQIDLGKESVFTYKVTSETSIKGDFNFSNGDAGKTKINWSTGSKSFNIGDEFTVRVTSEDSNYEFGGWYIATSYGTLPEGCLKIVEDLLNKEVTITVLKQITGVDVYPIYYKKPMIEDFRPATTGLNTVAKDTPIVIKFASKIEKPYLEKVKITKNGEDVSACFLTPEVSSDGTTVTYNVNYDNLLTVNGSNESIVVTIPEDISYKTEDGVVISAGVIQTRSYRVKPQTDKTLLVSFRNTSSGGIMNYSGTKNLSMGESLEIMYSTLPGYSFTGWTITGTPSEILYNEEDLNKDTITITAKNEGSVSVTGNAVFYPEISDYEPKYTSVGTDCDTPIVVTFNTIIDPDTLNSSTIKLTNRQTGVDYTDEYFHFDSVVTDQGVTKLTITPDPYINKLFMNGKTSYQIDVKFDKTSIFAKEEGSSGNENVCLTGRDNWYYVINSGYEDVLPVIKEIHLYKDPEYTVELTSKEFASWNDEDFAANHVKNLYVKVIGYDVNSGLKQIDVSETYLKTISEADVVKDPEYSILGNKDSFVLLKDSGGNPIVNDLGGNLYEYKGQYNFSKNFNDGLMKLEFRLVDRAGDNGTVYLDFEKERGNYTLPSTFFVIKDTSIAASHIIPSTSNTSDNRSLNASGMDTITMKFDSYQKYMTDSYYGGETHYGDYYGGHYDKLTITNIAYGYSAGNITFPITYSSETKTYSFDRDPYRETYITITAEDSVGNSFTRVVAIPEAGVLISKSKKMISIESYNSTASESYKIPSEYGNDYGEVPEYTMLIKDFSENCPIEYKNKFHSTKWGCDDPENAGEIFWERGGGKSQWNYIVNGASVFKSTQKIVTNYDASRVDKYYFYGLARYAKTKFTYEFDNWDIYGIESNTIDLYAENTETDYDAYIPQKFASVELESIIPNMGTRFVNTVFDEYTKNENYKYVVGYQVCDEAAYNSETDEYNTFFSYSANNDFSLVSDRKYRIVPFAKTLSGDYIRNTNAEYYEIDLTGVENDNFPPTLNLPANLGDRVSNKPGSVTLPFPYDKYGLYTDENGKGIIKYWFIPNSTVSSAITPRPDSYFKDEDARLLEFDTENPPANMVFNLEGLPEYSYTLFFKVEDKNHNYVFQSAYARNTLYNQRLKYEYFVDKDKEVSDDTAATYFKCVFPQEQSTSYVDFETFDNGEWKLICKIYGCEYFPDPNRNDSYDPETCTWDIRNNLTFYFSPTRGFYKEYNRSHNTVGEYSFDSSAKVYNAAVNGKFMRILGRDMAYGDGTTNGYYKALYVYPKYLMGGITCKNKFLLSSASGDIQVMADAPVLVHTFYSSSDFGDNIDNWLNQGVETGVVEEDGGFTYSNDNFDEIPTGRYYATVVHFADGTIRISDVNIKK